MTPELHRIAGDIFDRACRLGPDQRTAYLDSACAANPELRAYVEQLLASDHDVHQNFLGKPAIFAAALYMQGGAPPQLAGTRLGTYEIVRQIGAGGMGVVYEARDLRLNRPVALKVLASTILGDDGIRRFQQEAHAASRLSHPHIVSLYDAGQERGIHYIATELVEGRTLRQLAAEGTVPIRQLVDIATQTASALSAAHEAGIIHRDVKPENIMLRNDGFVKVLDFGLAKVNQAAASNTETQAGIVAGTVHYLSPEQALGKPLGPGSDLFSLGIVLYELATGARPFTGATDWAVLEAIMRHDPGPASRLRPEIDAGLDALIGRLLEKQPGFRFQTAADLSSSLKLLRRDSDSGGSLALQSPNAPPIKPTAVRWPKALLVTAGVVAVAAGGWRIATINLDGLTRPDTAAPRHFERLTSSPGEETSPNLSPDGSQFIYAGLNGRKRDIFLQRTGGLTVVNLTAGSQADNSQPALSRDGMKIAFRSERDGGGLFVMEATGENPRRLSTQGYLPAWSPDGKLLVYSTGTFAEPSARGGPSSLHIVNLSTEADRELKTGDAIQPSWSPKGHSIAYWGVIGGRREIFVASADPGSTRQPVRLTDDGRIAWNPVWSPDGRFLYFVSDRSGVMNLWKLRVNEKTGEADGEVEPITMPTPRMGSFNISADGRALIFAHSERTYNLFYVPYDAARRKVTGVPKPVSSETNYMANFSFSPDQSQIVFDTLGAAQEDLWVMNRDGTGRRRLDADPAKDRCPIWSPTGNEIAFFSDRTGRYEVWLIQSDGSGLRQVTETNGLGMQVPRWSVDGKRLYSARENGLLYVFPAHEGLIRSLQPALPTTVSVKALWARDSPDMRLLALGSFESGPIRLFHRDGNTVETLEANGEHLSWLPDGSAILRPFRGEARLYDLKSAADTILFDVSPGRIYDLNLSGDRIYFTRAVLDGDLWLGRFQ